jgi:hypothetical protein
MNVSLRARLRRLVLGTSPFVLTAALAFACRVTPLDVGEHRPVLREEPDASAPAVDAAEGPEAAPTLEQRLRARCAEEPGPVDDYFSGAELTARLVGRWFNCGPAAASSFQDGDGDGIVFTPEGTWAFLSWTADREGFEATWGTDLQHGAVRYYFFVDSEAGAAADSGIGSGNIALDDTNNRTPLVVYLDRPGTPDGNNLTFSKKPRQMTVVESASALRARYVPIDGT